jgi:large subunit ribosomal protein L21
LAWSRKFLTSPTIWNRIVTMFAVIETGGKQYIVAEGDNLKIEKLPKAEGDTVTFDKVLLISDGDKIELGKPYLDKTVEADISKQGRGRKIRIMRYHSKTRHRRRKGHRQHFTEVKIKSIKK